MGRREHAPLPLGALGQPEGRPTLASSGHMLTSHRPDRHRTAVSGSGSMKRAGRETGTAPLTDFTTPTDPPIARSTPARKLHNPAHGRGRSTAGQVGSALPCTSTCRSRTVTEISAPTGTDASGASWSASAIRSPRRPSGRSSNRADLATAFSNLLTARLSSCGVASPK
jgi:hypothetical protein